MKGLILKDYYCMRKSLPMMIMVSLGTIFLAVMFVLSSRYGNIANSVVAAGEEIGEIGEKMTQEEFYAIFRTAILLVLFIPMAFAGQVIDCFKEDKSAGFSKFLFSLPVEDKKIVGARYITGIAYLGIGVLASVIAAASVSLASDELIFAELLSIILFFVGVMFTSVATMIPLTYLVGTQKVPYIMAGICVVFAMGGYFVGKYFWNRYEVPEGVDPESLEWAAKKSQELVAGITGFLNTKGILILVIGFVILVLSYFGSVTILKKKRGLAV